MLGSCEILSLEHRKKNTEVYDILWIIIIGYLGRRGRQDRKKVGGKAIPAAHIWSIYTGKALKTQVLKPEDTSQNMLQS